MINKEQYLAKIKADHEKWMDGVKSGKIKYEVTTPEEAQRRREKAEEEKWRKKLGVPESKPMLGAGVITGNTRHVIDGGIIV